MLVILRDGRKLIGVLRSYDQFGELKLAQEEMMWVLTCAGLPANLVLEDTVERLFHGSAYGDIHRGVFLIRGENVVLLGEVVSHPCLPAPAPLSDVRIADIQDLDKEDNVPLTPAPLEHIIPLHRQEIEQRKIREAAKAKVLYEQKGW